MHFLCQEKKGRFSCNESIPSNFSGTRSAIARGCKGLKRNPEPECKAERDWLGWFTDSLARVSPAGGSAALSLSSAYTWEFSPLEDASLTLYLVTIPSVHTSFLILRFQRPFKPCLLLLNFMLQSRVSFPYSISPGITELTFVLGMDFWHQCRLPSTSIKKDIPKRPLMRPEASSLFISLSSLSLPSQGSALILGPSCIPSCKDYRCVSFRIGLA